MKHKNSYHLVGIPTINIINSKFILYAKIMRAVKKKKTAGNKESGVLIRGLPWRSSD